MSDDLFPDLSAYADPHFDNEPSMPTICRVEGMPGLGLFYPHEMNAVIGWSWPAYQTAVWDFINQGNTQVHWIDLDDQPVEHLVRQFRTVGIDNQAFADGRLRVYEPETHADVIRAIERCYHETGDLLVVNAPRGYAARRAEWWEALRLIHRKVLTHGTTTLLTVPSFKYVQHFVRGSVLTVERVDDSAWLSVLYDNHGELRARADKDSHIAWVVPEEGTVTAP